MNSGFLQVCGGHRIYYEVRGNSVNPAVCFLHGGPGGGMTIPENIPDGIRVVFFDQRGCGKSTRHLEDNTTWNLVDDIEKLREMLGISRWVVCGGSWGATLALLYAQAYPSRVTGLVLRGTWLNRPSDIAWLYGSNGAAHFFPDEYAEFVKPIPTSKRRDIIQAYYEYLTGEDSEKRVECAKAYGRWEIITSRLVHDPNDDNESVDDVIVYSTIETYYFSNMSWMSDNQILENCDRIADIPTVILHGRYDLQTRVSGAYQLHSALPKSVIKIFDVGHVDPIFMNEVWNSIREIIASACTPLVISNRDEHD